MANPIYRADIHFFRCLCLFCLEIDSGTFSVRNPEKWQKLVQARAGKSPDHLFLCI